MLADGATGCVGVANKLGLSNKQIYLQYLDHFKEHTIFSKDHPVLFVLDNHSSHVS